MQVSRFLSFRDNNQVTMVKTFTTTPNNESETDWIHRQPVESAGHNRRFKGVGHNRRGSTNTAWVIHWARKKNVTKNSSWSVETACWWRSWLNDHWLDCPRVVKTVEPLEKWTSAVTGGNHAEVFERVFRRSGRIQRSFRKYSGQISETSLESFSFACPLP